MMNKQTYLVKSFILTVKKTVFFLSLYSMIFSVSAQTRLIENDHAVNFALSLDGNDNNPCIGMGILKDRWTIEAWVKGDDLIWKDTEAIIGVGEYGDVVGLDVMPLQIKKGHLHCPQANITSPNLLDDKWHYVALTNDTKEIKLYEDGKLVGTSKGTMSILPGTIGTYDKPQNTFGGLIDEVRIWDTALSQNLLQKWKNTALTAKHPAFKNLKAYYNFDELKDDVCLNLVGKGHQAFHMRNTRLDYKGKLPLAKLELNDNKQFINTIKQQEVFNAVTIESEWDAVQGAKDDQLLKIRVVVNGAEKALKLTDIKIDLSETSRLTSIDRLHIYYAGQTPRSTERKELFVKGGSVPSRLMHFKTNDHNDYLLKPGVNYFLVTLDINKEANLGDTLKANILSISLNGKQYRTETETSNIRKTIIPATGTTDIVKLLQWNIWHGGVHMGDNGRNRIKELIRSTEADIICMQEAYGAQKILADSLKFNMITASSSANLALFSRFSIEKFPVKENFKSNLAIITLPTDKNLLVADWWLRYAYRPEYTDYYLNKGLNTQDWIKEDQELGAEDAKTNLDTDIAPVIQNRDMPIIIAGDFNSGSHLDWTARAAYLHNGYGSVALPISKLMLDRGYTDSFRKLNPDEVTHPAGTFAAIFGHLQTSRIDFIYYKGEKLKPLASKIIRTAPEIDDVWPSDHSAVFTVFKLN